MHYFLQAEAKHAYLDNKLKEIHAIGNGPHLSELSRLQRSEQGRAGLSVALFDVLVTTDYAMQDEQEDIEVWYPGGTLPPPPPTHTHTHKHMHCASLLTRHLPTTPFQVEFFRCIT